MKVIRLESLEAEKLPVEDVTDKENVEDSAISECDDANCSTETLDEAVCKECDEKKPLEEGKFGELVFGNSLAMDLYKEYYSELERAIKSSNKQEAQKLLDEFSDDLDELERENKKWHKTFIEIHRYLLDQYQKQINEIVGDETPSAVVHEDLNDHSGKLEDIEFVMTNYVPDSIGVDRVNKTSDTTYEVLYNDEYFTIEFDPSWSEYVYTIDGEGPYAHRTYEFIVSDIQDLQNQRSYREEPEWEEYDDAYDDLDPIEQDRAHAALYGGDRTYCDCGKRLVADEDGYFYCPDCDR